MFRKIVSFHKRNTIKMNLTRESILEVLGNITEPDIKKDIVSANLIELLE